MGQADLGLDALAGRDGQVVDEAEVRACGIVLNSRVGMLSGLADTMTQPVSGIAIISSVEDPVDRMGGAPLPRCLIGRERRRAVGQPPGEPDEAERRAR